MADFGKKLVEESKLYWTKLSIGQKATMISLIAALLLSVIFFSYWINKPQYSVLFSNLSLEDANTVVEKLNEKKIKYRLEQQGTAILVPQKEVYNLRMQLAADGIPKRSGVGFEIFDNAKIGMSERVQQINYQRALEGELIRTIEGIEGIEKARIHLVIPKKSLFEEDQQKTSASIYLKLVKKNALKKEQIEGIAHLVSSSVEGLEPNNITIIDNFGNQLNQIENNEYAPNLNASQNEVQVKVENYYKTKVEQLLEEVVGANKAKVSVTAELDYDKIEQTKEIYDPNSATPRSEENIEESSEVTGDNKTHNITNYEISKTIEHVVKSVGVVKKLSVAVLIDGRYKTENNKKVYEPRNAEELAKIEDLVKKAIGFDPNRGDQVGIQNMEFDRTDFIAEMEAMNKAERMETISKSTKWAIFIALVLLVLFILYRIINNVTVTIQKEIEKLKPQPSPEELAKISRIEELAQFGLKKDMTDTERKYYLIQEELKEAAKKNPKEMAQLIRTWLISERLK